MDKARTLAWLAKEGLPQFELDESGYPVPGKVVRYYREQMKYLDPTMHTLKHWTQKDLAERLGIKEIAVSLMETNNQSLDSIERRRALVTILRIPPALLGLGSLESLVEIAPNNEMPTKKGKRKRAGIDKDTIKYYQDTLSMYESLYAKGLTYTIIDDMDRWITRLEVDTKNASNNERIALLYTLWGFERLCGKVYGSDFHDWNRAFKHIDNTIELAMNLDDKDLQAASLYTSGVYRSWQGKLGLARIAIDNASVYARGALPQTKAAILSQNACLHAYSTNTSEIIATQKLFDEAQKYAGVKSEKNTVKFERDDYFIDRACAIIRLGQPAKALELIEDAERLISPSKKRYQILLDILRAKCYILQKKPEYDSAISLLTDAIEDSKEIRVERNIAQIEKLYRKLIESPYGNAPDVVDLGLALQDLRAQK